MNIYITHPVYDQIAHLKDFIDSQRVEYMHSEFRSGLEHDEVGTGKAGSKMENRKEAFVIILARDIYPN